MNATIANYGLKTQTSNSLQYPGARKSLTVEYTRGQKPKDLSYIKQKVEVKYD